MKFHWWDDAVREARAFAQWTNLRHSVRGVLEDGLWLWVVEPGEPLNAAAIAAARGDLAVLAAEAVVLAASIRASLPEVCS